MAPPYCTSDYLKLVVEGYAKQLMPLELLVIYLVLIYYDIINNRLTNYCHLINISP